MAAIRMFAASLLGLLVCAALVSSDPAAPVTVSGQVLLPDGTGAGDVRVLAGYWNAADEKQWTETRTGADGKFGFTLAVVERQAAVMLYAMKPGFALAHGWYEGKAEDAVLRLGAKPAALAGTVVDEQGQPVDKAEVTPISGRIGPPSQESLAGRLDFYKNPFLRCTSNAQGEFRLADLPPESTVWFQVVAEHKARLSASRDLSATGPLRLVLRPEATIAGHAAQGDKPVAGLKVGAQSEHAWAEAVTGADGAYLLEHLDAGRYNVMVADFSRGLTAAAVEGVRVKEGDHVAGVDLALTPGALVQGKVTSAAGTPVAGALVASYGPARPKSGAACQNIRTAADGTYTMRLPAGHSKLYYQGNAPGFSFNDVQPKNREIDLQEGETKTGQDFVLTPTPKLHGQVLLPDGKPAAGVAIRRLGTTWIGNGVRDPDTTTDAQGNFELSAEDPFGQDHLPPQILAQDTDHGLAALVEVPNPAQALTLRLAPGAYLAARAVDLAGQPVPKVPITAQSDSYAPMTTAQTDADGRVLLGPLPVGVQVQFDVAGRWQYLIATNDWDGLIVTPTVGAVQQLPALRLNPQGRSLKGWVGDAQQQPVAGALVYAPGVEEPATTDAQGHFELTGLPARGTLTIVAAHPTEALFAVKEIDPDWGFTPGLALQALGAVTGQVVDAAGQPVARARIFLQGPLSPQYDWRQLSERLREDGYNPSRPETDAEGRFRFEGLLPGATYQVLTPRDTGRGGETKFVVVPGQTVELGEVK